MDSIVLDASMFVNACGIMGAMPTTIAPLTRSDVAACCSPLTGGVLDNPAAERLASVFKALADPARVKLVSLIAASDGGEACICDLTEPLGLSQPTVSHHMKLLVDSGLVSRDQRGKWAYYRVNTDALDRISAAVSTQPG
ncbi:metalloregulator ArsR/SmtB family transcription factor [Mycolicibacterium sp. CR10]|uniref:ArsR/SmtB family transcription factor n=1 Tax=Mycolicibacterium sp. CR10 TaxID=2562314 RepID=UPI00148591B7